MTNPLIGALDDVTDLLPQANRVPQNPPIVGRTTGSGHCDRNWVEVTITNGRMTDCRVREDAFGLDPEQLGELIQQATNRALAEHEAALVATLQQQQHTDLAQLGHQLAQISREAERGMNEYLEGMRTLLADTRREADK
ncbi:hypothetical protein HJ590_03335 [Naumannella sp. ID2617S]|nr:hypothetical protein [Naumannella sp. ID2617S]